MATGGIAKLVESMLGKKFIHFGKPDSQMFMYAYESLVQEIGPLEKNDVLMVGATLETDILGGNRFGVGTMLVLSGNSRSEHIEREISATGIIPDYICEDILS